MENKIFIDGIRIEPPRPNAPQFVKARMSIFAEKLIPFVQANKNERGYLNIDILESKKGTWYGVLNTYKKADTQSTQESPKADWPEVNNKEDDAGISIEDVPF